MRHRHVRDQGRRLVLVLPVVCCLWFLLLVK
jgi:hypothetical protein